MPWVSLGSWLVSNLVTFIKYKEDPRNFIKFIKYKEDPRKSKDKAGLTHFRKLQDFRNFSTHFHYPCEWPRTVFFFLPPTHPPGLLMVVLEEIGENSLNLLRKNGAMFG